MPKKRHTISEEDLEAFQQAMKGTKPLKSNKIRLAPPLEGKKPIRKHIYHDDTTFTLSEKLALDPVQGEEFISFKQNGISNKTLRKLRKGQYNVEAILDLHGLSIEEAKSAVEYFLQQCSYEKIRIALIIHGKGHHSEMPILKNKLNHWLRELDFVLAFCSAAPFHGSRGAVYVLLRRSTEENSFE